MLALLQLPAACDYNQLVFGLPILYCNVILCVPFSLFPLVTFDMNTRLCLCCCCSHLPVLASAIAAFNASNLDAQQLSDPYADSSMADDQETDTSRSCGAAAQHQQDQEAAAQQQQRPEAASQAAEAARQVLMELCEALQRLDAAAIDAPGVTRCMSAMARLRHYDWLTMRHMSQLAAAHAQVCGASRCVALLCYLIPVMCGVSKQPYIVLAVQGSSTEPLSCHVQQ